MNIDVVVGNPPYNNDIYIPFVEMGHNLSSTCSVFITPAKWQAKGGAKNEQFRQNIVPHMSKIVYYPDCKDVFNIQVHSGISYYLISKNEYKDKLVTVICNKSVLLNCKKHTRELIEPMTLYSGAVYNICDKVGCFNKIFKNFKSSWIAIDKNINIFMTTVAAQSGGRTFANDGKLLMLSVPIRHDKTFYKSNDYKCIYSATTKDEADSFESWMNTKFIRFMVFISWCSFHINNETWRFVPDPITFDHIFTDEELYKKYNLTPEEINIIESVIKERK
jgi:site-specific DNA-methyltransferase (adenine-specific)